MNKSAQLPFIVKAGFTFICGFSLILFLNISKSILIPFVYATILAVLLNPLVGFLTRHKFNRTVAIFIAVFLTMIVLGFIIYLVFKEISTFFNTYSKFGEKVSLRISQLASWITNNFDVNKEALNNWVKEKKEGMGSNFGLSIETILGMVSTIGMLAILMPVYIIMILFYKPLILEFTNKLFSTEHQTTVFDIITKSKKIIQIYLIGLIVEMILIAVLNSIGLIILGIDYAIILGIIAALINIIPVLGGVIAIIPPMIIAFITKESSMYPLLVVIIFFVNQIIDKYFIIPLIVASKVKINALVSIVVVFIGGALWGIPGMFISIPVTAILKVIFDNIEILKPIGFLLGNIVTLTPKRLFFMPKLKKN